MVRRLRLVRDGDSLERDLDIQIEPRFELGSAPADADPVVNVLLTLRPEGPPLSVDREGPAAHVILAIDVSASMNRPDKYPVLVRALQGLLAELQSPAAPETLVSIVLFAYGSETIFHAVPARSLTARAVVAAMDGSLLRFGRYTDLEGGLSRCGRLAHDSHRLDRALPIRICVLTDGRPQDQDGASDVMDVVRRLPVDADALAFGADAAVDRLQELFCGSRGGTVKHVRSDTLVNAYERVASALRKVVAKRALLSLDLGPGVVGGAAYRFRPGRHAFGRGAFRMGTRFETDLGTLEDGRTYSLLFEVRLPETEDEDTEVGRVEVRVPGWGGPRVFSSRLVIPRHHGELPIDADPVVQEAREILGAVDQGDPETLLRALRARRRMYVAERRDPYLLDVVDKAIHELEETGNLSALSRTQRAALTAHTATAGSLRQRD